MTLDDIQQEFYRRCAEAGELKYRINEEERIYTEKRSHAEETLNTIMLRIRELNQMAFTLKNAEPREATNG